MRESLTRIYGMFLRYFYLHKRSLSRTLEIVFWPVMELFLWGYLTLYLKTFSPGAAAPYVVFLIGSVIFWDILYRGKLGISTCIIEDIWTLNISNLFVSPLKIWEWFLASFLYSLAKSLLITGILCLIALGLYQFDFVGVIGFYFIPLAVNLYFFSLVLGIFTWGLLIRWGHSVEGLIWGIPFLLQPFSAIFYPVSVLPMWVQKVALFLPSTYVFEGMRKIFLDQKLPLEFLIKGGLLNLLYLSLSTWFFFRMLMKSRDSGRLGRLGMD